MISSLHPIPKYICFVSPPLGSGSLTHLPWIKMPSCPCNAIFSKENNRSRQFVQRAACFQGGGIAHKVRVPVYVMMPIDVVTVEGCNPARIQRIRSLTVALRTLKLAGVEGVIVDVWWGVVERHTPLEYDWGIYEQLFHIICQQRLKIQVVFAFHACIESFPNSRVHVGLPLWINEIGRFNNDIYYTDRHGFRNEECLTLGVDKIPLFHGRTALECYADFMSSFVDKFNGLFGHTIQEITIGLGPSGELRYPAHPSFDGRWMFPGIGEFQCYDKYMLAELHEFAMDVGEPTWGYSGPQDAGNYNSFPEETVFFHPQFGNLNSQSAQFFLKWYSGKLIEHADQVLGEAKKILQPLKLDPEKNVLLVAKLAGIHWWYCSHSHAAELTAGYYNTSCQDGYAPIAAIFAKHGAALNMTCIEMVDSEQPEYCWCSPESLLAQLQQAAEAAEVPLTAENALLRFDKACFDRVVQRSHQLQRFAFTRMAEPLFRTRNWIHFTQFMRQMNCHHGQGDSCTFCKSNFHELG